MFPKEAGGSVTSHDDDATAAVASASASACCLWRKLFATSRSPGSECMEQSVCLT